MNTDGYPSIEIIHPDNPGAEHKDENAKDVLDNVGDHI